MFIEICEEFKIDNISNQLFDNIFSEEFVFSGESHDFWEIVYINNGKIEMVENDKVYLMSEGDMIFHAPMEFHRLRSAENTRPHIMNLSFTVCGKLPENLKDGIFTLSSEQKNTYINLFRFIYDEFINTSQNNAFIAQEAACRLSSFILNLCRNSESKEIISSTPSANTYKSLVRLMHKEVNSSLPLQEFANKSFISLSYMKVLFKHYAGISPKTYYNNLRLTEAKRLLLEGLSVSDTADKMNFSSPNHFIRFFKTNTGKTPLQYKKE